MSLEDSKKKKNYSNVAPLSTKSGRLHAKRAKIKKALEPIGKVVESVVNWVKEDFKNAKPGKPHRRLFKKPKKDWENIH